MKFGQLAGSAIAILMLSMTAHAQILIGQTAGFTGAVAAGVKEITDGAKLYIDSINAKGGVNGQKIELLSMDDKFTPKLAAENAKELIEKKNVVAMFLTRGTPHTQAIIAELDKYGVPLIGPSTGAMVLHKPVQKHVFNVRATYQHEAERAIAHLATIGITRIAVIYPDDTFGADLLEGAQRGLDTAKLKAVMIEKFDRSKPDFSPIAPQVAKSEAQAVVFIGSATAVVDGVKAIKAAGSGAQIITMSNNASGGFIKLLGENARGVIVSQVFPQTFAYPIVKEATLLGKASNIPDVSPAMLEGYAAAKVLVEALRRSGPNPTRERIQAALESIQKFDLGGLEINYSPTDHTGLYFVDLSIIGPAGKFRR